MELIVSKVSNGYIIRDSFNKEIIFFTLQEVFECLLSKFEGKSKYFNGKSWGEVIINNSETVAN